MEFLQEVLQDVTHYVVYHPFYAVAASFVLLFGLLHLYCRITLGICDSQQDMSNKTVLVTGASAGIGKYTAMEMARRNARVLLACRNIGKANKVAEEIKRTTGNPNVFVKSLDLTSFASVRACAKSVLETEDKLHVLINNAGIAAMKKRILTEDGNELTMQSNHLGHFLLTLLLLDLLKRSSPSRIINVSSEAHRFHKFDAEDLNNEKGVNERTSLNVYGNTKLANIYFTFELANRLQGSGVTVNALHPGVVRTSLLGPLMEGDTSNGYIYGFILLIVRIVIFMLGKTSEEGAQTTIQLAVDPRLENTSGKYFMDCKVASVMKIAKDKQIAKRLFEVSEKIVGESFRN